MRIGGKHICTAFVLQIQIVLGHMFFQKSSKSNVRGNSTLSAAHLLAALKQITHDRRGTTDHSVKGFFPPEWRIKSHGLTDVIVPMATYCLHKVEWEAIICAWGKKKKKNRPTFESAHTMQMKQVYGLAHKLLAPLPHMHSEKLM